MAGVAFTSEGNMKISEDYDPAVIATLQGLGVVDNDITVQDFRPLPGQTNGLGLLGQVAPASVAMYAADFPKAVAGGNLHPFDKSSGAYQKALKEYESPLRVGTRGNGVRMVQRVLTALGYPAEDDGIFGDKTRLAVRAFQKSQGMTEGGVWNAETRMKAGALMAAPTFDPTRLLVASVSLKKLGIDITPRQVPTSLPIGAGGPGGNVTSQERTEVQITPGAAGGQQTGGGQQQQQTQEEPKKDGEGLAKLLKNPWYWVAVGGVLFVAYMILSKRKQSAPALPAGGGMGALLDRSKGKKRK